MTSRFHAYLAKSAVPSNPLAEAAIAYGVPVFPCAADKSPVTRNGFKDASADPAAIRTMFANPNATMIGMPTGEITGVVVIDVDIKENRQGTDWLAEQSSRMVQTRTIRTGSGGLHIYYRHPGQRVKNSNDKIAPGIDCRGDGGYVVIPPSPGYAVADDAPVAELPEWLLTTLCPPEPVAPPQPAPQPRQAAPEHGGTPYGLAALDGECHAIRSAGYGNQEFTLNAAGLKIGALIAGGELDEGPAVAALLSAGRSIGSQPGKRPWASGEVDGKLRRAIQDGKRQARTAPEVEMPVVDLSNIAPFMAKLKAQAQAAKAIKALPVSADIMAVDGALGAFVDYCETTAISSQPFLALAAGICVIGALAGRRYRTRTNLRTNIYAVGIADSGGGKDHARKRIKAVLGAAGLHHYLGGEDIASGAGMLAALVRHPAQLFQIDEFGDWLGGVLSAKAPAHKKQIAERFKTLYSSADSWIAGTEYAGQNHKDGLKREDIQQPHACLYGTTTPGQFWAAIAGGSLHDGLLARVLICLSPVSYPDERDADPGIEPPAALVEAFQAIAAGVPGGGNLSGLMTSGIAPDPYLVEATPAAEKAIRALRLDQLAMQRKAEGTYVTAIAARWAENAVKLALVRAVSRDPVAPSIQEVDVAWGRALAKHCIDTLLEDAERHVAANDFDRRCNQALEIIRKHGPVTEHVMQDRYSWKFRPQERSEALRDLVGRGKILAIPSDATKPGRPTIRYAIDPDGVID